MSTEGKILTNAVILAVGEAIGQVANFAFVILLARRYGTELFGQYSLAMAVGATACIVVSLGVHDVLTRDVGHEPEKGQASFFKWVPAEFGSAFLAWIAIALVTAWIDIDPTLKVIIVAIGAYQIALHLAGLFYLQFAARGRMMEPSVVDALHRVVVLAAAGLAMLLNAPATAVIWLLPVIACIEVAIAAWQGHRAFGPDHPPLDPRAITNFVLLGSKFLSPKMFVTPMRSRDLAGLVRRGRPFLALGFLSVLQIRASVILLAMLSGSVATGVYAAADRLILPIIMVQDIVVRAAYPAMLRLWTSDRGHLVVVAQNCLKVMFLVAIPLSGMIFVFRHDVIAIVFGEQFENSAGTLAVLAWMPVAVGAIFLYSAQAFATNLDNEAAKINAVVVAVLIIASVVLIYFQGAFGLSIAVVSTATSHAVALSLLLEHHKIAPKVLVICAKPAIAAAAGIASHFFIGEYGLPLRLATVTTVILLALWLLGSIRMEEIRETIAALEGPPKPEEEAD